jgi:hypothetical protein
LQLAANGGTDIFISANDNIGFGNTAPVHKVSINGTTFISNNAIINANLYFGTTTSNTSRLFLSTPSGDGTVTLSGDGTNFGVYRAVGGSYFQLGTTTAVPLYIISNNSNRVMIAANGNIGIGNSNPAYPLYVAAAADGAIVGFESTSSNGFYSTYFNGSSITGYIGTANRVASGSNTDFGIGTPGAAGVFLSTNNSVKFYVSANGNVGIGTTPSSKLHVYGDANSSVIKITDATLGSTYGSYVKGYGVGGVGGFTEIGVVDSDNYSKGITISQQANYVAFNTGYAGSNSNVERMRIAANGNIGIGTASPTQKLHVVGLINSSDGSSDRSYIGWKAGSTYGYSGLHLINIDNSSLVLGTNNTARTIIDVNGNVISPNQPYCRAVSSAGNVTVVNGNQVIPYNSALSNIGSHFNTSTYRFTMPVAGKYLVTASIQLNGGSAQYYNLYIRVNGSGQFGTFQTGSGLAYQQFSTTGVVNGSATDYIDVALFAVSGSGTLECSGDTRCSLSITLLS